MRQHLSPPRPAEPRTAANEHPWISTGLALLAIAAAATLCFASFVEADRSLQRLDLAPGLLPVSSIDRH